MAILVNSVIIINYITYTDPCCVHFQTQRYSILVIQNAEMLVHTQKYHSNLKLVYIVLQKHLSLSICICLCTYAAVFSL